MAQNGKEFACKAGDSGSIPGSERSPEETNDYPVSFSCLENPMDRGAWWATVHEVAKSQTQLSDCLSTHTHPNIEQDRGKRKKKKQCRKKKQDSEDREVRKSHTMKTPDGHWPSGRVWIYFNQISKRQQSPKWQLGSMWQNFSKGKRIKTKDPGLF